MIERFGVMAVAAVLVGCGDGRDAPGPATTTDTVAGVIQVRHAGAAPEWDAEPLLTLGRVGAAAGAPSPDEFGRVESVIADAAGRLYVADGMALEVRVFEPDGRFVRRLGRQGSGPGEMEGIHGAAWLGGDTLVVPDWGNARLMRMTVEGEEVGTWRWVRITGSTRFHFNTGPLELYAFGMGTGPDGQPTALWVRHTPEGPSDTLVIPRVDPRPGAFAVCRGEGIGFFHNPFGDRLIAAPAPGGERVVAWASEYRLAFIDPAGDTVRVLSRDAAPVPLPDSAWAPAAEAYREFEETWRGADCEGSIVRPGHRPVLRDVFFDHDGRMLVEHTTAGGAAFDLYATDGRWLASIPAPPGRDPSVPPFLRDDRLYVVTQDSLGVQQVRSFRVGERIPAGPG